MNKLSERLEYVLKTSGITQTELAQRLGVKQQAISRVCRGQTKNSTFLLPMCDELGVDSNWLSTGVGEPFVQRKELKDQIRRIPEVSWKQAICWDEFYLTFDSSELGEYWRVTADLTDEKGFVLRVHGDGMEGSGSRNIPEGAIIIVQPQVESLFKSGDLVIAVLPGAEQAIFKQLIIEGQNRYLKSFNPQYPIITLDDKCKLVGLVKQSVVEY
ncbi:helix-turn-helix domain-containing protein [Parashewanella spongiae]|uniref:Helix-turn-helix domain-containing protein n=1 Tax=Parashewanella spongiae TaxID=342950 RepID=A0A3A6UK12_9GAMM|nr:LexA family transcriptional regulator [Parashewanella spongiae]MCL1076596.1 LexA family transcriptional regulator [Parashewanella spongiae]RJY19552.1 helix-turn-helix domain-containing protein [Parashewanella spongiae]